MKKGKSHRREVSKYNGKKRAKPQQWAFYVKKPTFLPPLWFRGVTSPDQRNERRRAIPQGAGFTAEEQSRGPSQIEPIRKPAEELP